MNLPNPDLAVIDDRKLAWYSLNLDHDEGKHKARVFKAALDMDVSHPWRTQASLFEVEFSDTNGRAYAIETLNSAQLLVLHHQGKELMMAG